MKYKLTKVYRTTKDKEGNELKTRDGRPYERLAVKVAEHGDKWISGFGSRANTFFKEGSEVEINIEQKGEYLNFSMPNVWDAIKELQKRVSQLEEGSLEAGKRLEVPEVQDEIPDDLFG